MRIEPTPEQELQENSKSRPAPRGRWAVLLGAFVLIMPVLAFWATELFPPEWQDGKLGSYLILLLSPKASWIFFPLLAFSVFSYLFFLVNPVRFSQQFTVRFGIYVGVVLALHFSIVSGLYFVNGNPASRLLILLWIVPLIVPKIYKWTVSRWSVEIVAIVVLILLLAGFIFAAVTTSIYTPFLLVLAALTMAAPFWCFLIFLQTSTWLFKNAETSITLPRGLGLAGWLGAYAVAWRMSILKMYELYAALPPQPPPDCYIATAAAQGHPHIVGSRTVLRADGKLLNVNRQLQILKCAELALMAMHPRLHKLLRRGYDVVGKSLARSIQNPFLADATYLLLKPFEWLAMFVLKLVVPGIDEIAKMMYTK